VQQEAFLAVLKKAGVTATLRREKGHDIDAACGQLKGQVLDRTRRQAEFKRSLDAAKVNDAAA
jgi:23S rRNA (adenine2503-C2)-methyltransferase